MPLIGDFGGRVGIDRFLQSPTILKMLPSLFCCRELFSFCHTKGLQWVLCRHMREVQKKYVALKPALKQAVLFVRFI